LLNEVQAFQTNNTLANDTPLKIRVDVFPDGEMKTTMAEVSPTVFGRLYPTVLFEPAEASKLSLSHIVVDPLPTLISPFTWLKTARRDSYDEARQRMTQILSKLPVDQYATQGGSEIILHNPANEVTEGSVTNIYFWRNGWITPPAGSQSGGLEGVVRRWALERELCKGVEKVMIETVHEGEIVWISNGVRGFHPGVIVSEYPGSE
jgi:4-amino-4-deoxychorismate lyase